MKICYVDESGNNNDPCFVMVGIVVDTYHLNRTRTEFAGFLDDTQQLFNITLKEIKGSRVIPGRGLWRQINSDRRKKIAENLCDWIVQRKHSLVISAIDRKKHQTAQKPRLPKACEDTWLSAALHIALQIQKAHQTQDKNKGHTFLVFDENKMKTDHLAELLWEPPEWTDSYYERKKKQERFDQVIDSAFMVKSHHAGLVQVADLYAYIFRRYSEMTDFNIPEEWNGERDLVTDYVRILTGRLLPKPTRYPDRTSSEAAKWYNSIAPDSLLKLGKKNND